jgi:dCMP deaminase
MSEIEQEVVLVSPIKQAIDDQRFLKEAVQAAAQMSHDPRTQNGAVIVCYPLDIRHAPVVIGAANCFPPGIAVTPERTDPAVKLKYIEHAERNAVYAAARYGQPTENATMYCPWFACVDCARAIICAGIKRCVGLQKPRLITPERWQATIAEADELLKEAGIQVNLLDIEVGVEILFNGEKVTL